MSIYATLTFKAPNLAGLYGRSCIEGRYDMYSYVPYTNVPAPALRSSATQPTDHAKKGTILPYYSYFSFANR